MDYPTARTLLIRQGTPPPPEDSLLQRLSQGKPPIPGEVTRLLLALKIVFEALRGLDSLDRDLVYALHCLASESRSLFNQGQNRGILWTPLLNEDLDRIAIAVRSIFAGTWE